MFAALAIALLVAGGMQAVREWWIASRAPAELAEMNWEEFRREIEGKIERAKALVDRAASFEAEAALEAARKADSPNGFSYRFLDHLREAERLDPRREGSPPDGEPIESSYQKLRAEGRPAFELRPDEAMRFAVELPAEPLGFAFGLGPEKADPRAKLEIVLRFGGRQETLAVAPPEVKGWEQVRLELPEWAWGKGSIEWKLQPESGAEIYLGDPVIFGRPVRPLNVILILEDTLRADHLSAYGYHRRTSPVKDAFFAEGAIFEHAFSQGPTTVVSCPALMTSLYPSATGVFQHADRIPDSALTLAEILRDQGFATAALLQNGYAGQGTGLHQGYERVYLTRGPKKFPTSEEFYTSKAIEWIEDSAGRNRFLYIHVFDPHHPYRDHDAFTYAGAELREEEIRRADPLAFGGEPGPYVPGDRDGFRISYGGEIRKNDFYFGEFISQLEERELVEDTLFVFVSDHGEYFGEQGRWLHTPPGRIQVTRVPLMMRHPTLIPSGKRYDEPVQLVDVVPTILDLLEIPLDPFLLSGDSLTPLMRREGDREFWRERVIFSEENQRLGASFIRGPWHVLSSQGFLKNFAHQKKLGGGPPLPVRLWKQWRLAGEQLRVFHYLSDPTESAPRPALSRDTAYLEEVIRLRDALRGEYAAVHALLARNGSEEYEFDPETIEKLKDLGYL